LVFGSVIKRIQRLAEVTERQPMNDESEKKKHVYHFATDTLRYKEELF